MSSPTAKDIMDYLGQSGWEGLNRPEPEPQEPDTAQYDLDKAIRSVFGSTEGQIVLSWLRDVTIEQPAFDPKLGIIGILQGFSREGQNSMYREIVRRMKRAELGPPVVQKGE